MASIATTPKMRKCNHCAGYGYFPNPGTLVGSGMKERKNCNQCDGKGAFPDFTEEDKKAFMQACNNTFNAIADDCAQLGRLTKAISVEVTLDADRMDMFGVPYRLKDEEREKHIQRMRQIRYSEVAEKWCKEALFGKRR